MILARIVMDEEETDTSTDASASQIVGARLGLAEWSLLVYR